MNTQTHILLASALLIPAAPRLFPTDGIDWPYRWTAVAVFIGAIIPDASLFVMWGIAKLQSVPESIIWSEWYYSTTWQRIGTQTNSFIVFGAVAVLSVTLQRKLFATDVYTQRLNGVALTAALAALLHVATDLPLHHDDGHPHFWPVSDWIYASPVSYWDPNHHGQVWAIFELVLALCLCVFLWRRYENRLARAAVILAAISYFAALGYWLSASPGTP